ncbi:MAG TPA: Fur family transcriptional regulator [Bryobacteraceae bacterium]|nr:Fur family transcriptional regulator [Bryobacteraceae bacterium]
MNATRAEIASSFRERGLRCTSQRYAVLQYLLKHPCHPTVEEIHGAVNRRDPRVSRATVYNSLHALVGSGLVREVDLGGDATRFESRVERHHHFICDQCGGIEDIEWFEPGEIAHLAGLRPRSIRAVLLQGLCASCRAGKKNILQKKSHEHQ